MPNMSDRLLKKFGHDSLGWFYDLQFYLDIERIADEGLDLQEIERAVVETASQFEGVAIVLTAAELMKATERDSIQMKMKMGYHPKLSGDVLLHLKPGWINWKTLGTTHGSAYKYDTHVPLIWYGSGIKKGTTTDYVAITDIAATLSQLLKIAKPSGCTGKPIPDLFISVISALLAAGSSSSQHWLHNTLLGIIFSPSWFSGSVSFTLSFGSRSLISFSEIQGFT